MAPMMDSYSLGHLPRLQAADADTGGKPDSGSDRAGDPFIRQPLIY